MVECVETLAGYEADVGWVPETVCGITPPAAPGTEYYDDAGTKRFWPFGIVQSFEPEFSTNQIKKRGLGNRGITCNIHGKYETTISVPYYPVNLDRLEYALGSATGTTDHLPSASMVRRIKRDSPNAKEMWELFNMVKVDSFTIEASVDDAVMFTEECLAQYLQPGDTKAFSGFQTVTVGEMPIAPTCDMFMFYEGDIRITRAIIGEDVSSQFTGSEVVCTVANLPMNWSLSETDPTDTQVADVTVYVQGVAVTVISVVGALITLAAAPLVTDTVVVDYHYVDVLFQVSDYSIEVSNNQNANYGLTDGLPVPYEIVEGTREVTGSLTTNFANKDQYNQYTGDEYFHIFIGLGQLKNIVLKLGKWDSAIPPTSEDDLISEDLEYECQDILVQDIPSGW